MSVLMHKMKTPVRHNFIIVSTLIAPVILGIDFFQQHSLVLDLTESTIQHLFKRERHPLRDSSHMGHCSTAKATYKNNSSNWGVCHRNYH